MFYAEKIPNQLGFATCVKYAFNKPTNISQKKHSFWGHISPQKSAFSLFAILQFG